MSEIVNLNKARKARARAEAKAQAAENRFAFGRTRAEKVRGKAEVVMLSRKLDGARRDD
ncbi:MAG: DUF4169 family protein [Phenylobacterium sp.]|uniref:DUF4169 family protein n=1 Tax=Phenylobacterium sp. TaxID=1871053 RepID=UPI00391BDC4D